MRRRSLFVSSRERLGRSRERATLDRLVRDRLPQASRGRRQPRPIALHPGTQRSGRGLGPARPTLLHNAANHDVKHSPTDGIGFPADRSARRGSPRASSVHSRRRALLDYSQGQELRDGRTGPIRAPRLVISYHLLRRPVAEPDGAPPKNLSRPSSRRSRRFSACATVQTRCFPLRARWVCSPQLLTEAGMT
jgi:hypothetical protein